jgi:hypothetical protein
MRLPAPPETSVTLRNLTPHAVSVVNPDGSVTEIAVDGPAPRLTVDRVAAGTLRTGVGDIPLVWARVNLLDAAGTTDLPAAQAGVYLIVARLVAEAHPTRSDLLVPDGVVRDPAGRVVGCAALAVLRPEYPRR